MIISLIVAASENMVIGVGGALPWHLPDDLAYFKEKTTGHPVIMGRKTFESIGRALLGRLNIIITKNPAFVAEDPAVRIVHSLEEALEAAQAVQPSEAFVIGGGEIYKEAISKADRIYLTLVHTEIDGDTFFPDISSLFWREVSRAKHPADARHPYAFDFVVLEKRILIA